jgi:hypothetical protein
VAHANLDHPIGEGLSPFEIVDTLRWLGGRSSDDAPVAVLMTGPELEP